jgi:hypothetical protein
MSDLPPWWDKESARKRKQVNKRSKKQEEDRAKKIGGRVQPGSGSSYRAPQDVRNDDYLEQLKFTDADSFALKAKEWLAGEADASRFGRSHRMVIDFDKYGLRLVVTREDKE